MYLRIKLISLLAIIFLLKPNIVEADFDVVNSSASLKSNKVDIKTDYRNTILRNYLNELNSPISDFADEFIEYADQNNLDWRLVVSISGVESTFGKRIPFNSYNAYGWANGDYKFKSWEDSISHVSLTLNQKYYNKGADNINKIARRYAPPSTTWSWKVKYFMNKIDPVPVQFDL